MNYENKMKLSFNSDSRNEAFARIAVSAFIMQLDPTLSDISDIKTSVSEAVTNAIIHGYEGKEGIVELFCGYVENTVYIEITDTVTVESEKGVGTKVTMTKKIDKTSSL